MFSYGVNALGEDVGTIHEAVLVLVAQVKELQEQRDDSTTDALMSLADQVQDMRSRIDALEAQKDTLDQINLRTDVLGLWKQVNKLTETKDK